MGLVHRPGPEHGAMLSGPQGWNLVTVMLITTASEAAAGTIASAQISGSVDNFPGPIMQLCTLDLAHGAPPRWEIRQQDKF